MGADYKADVKKLSKFFAGVGGQVKPETAAYSRFAFSPNGSAVGFYQLAGDGEAEAGSAGGAVPGGVNAIKAVEHVGERVGRDAGAGVGDGNARAVVVRNGGNGYGSAGRRMAYGVVNQVADNLLDA